MADKKIYTYEDFKHMEEADFIKYIEENPKYYDWFQEAITRKEKRVTYPRKKVWSEEKGKEVYVADYDRQPRTHYSPISFFGVKKAFLEECIGVEKSTKSKKETFRDRIKAMKAPVAPLSDDKMAAIDAKMKEIMK